MMTIKWMLALRLVLLATLATAYVQPSLNSFSSKTFFDSVRTLSAHHRSSEISFLMDEYRDPSTGEVMDPYKILKVPRRADRQQIKKAYRNLSRRYHPDGARNREILPGSCNNFDDVRNHWERVKLSYEILSDPDRRKRYDRHEAWADPGEAMKRVAAQAAFDCVVNVGKSIWGVSAAAVSRAVHVSRATHQNFVVSRALRLEKTQEAERRLKRRKQLQAAMKKHFNNSTLVISTPNSQAVLLEQPSKKKGLRSLYQFGMLPLRSGKLET